MLKRRFDGKTIGTLFIMVMSVCLSAYASLRSADAWTLNPSDFRYDMTLYFSMSSKEYENLEAYEIGAFINDECRGLAENLELPDDESCMYMRIRSNSDEAEEVVFKMREKATGKITVLKGKDAAAFLFKPNEMVGLPSDPYILAPYYNVSIEAGENGSVDFTDGMYAQGSVIEVEAVPAEGYHFEEWSDGVTEAKRSITVDADITLTATFTVTTYKALFSIDGTEIATLSVDYGSKIEAPEAPEKEGYTFAGWTDLPETMPAKDIEITGTYTLNSYKVSFMIDGTLIEETEVAFGAEIVAPEAPEKEGYTFVGWSEIPSTMPAGNIEIVGTYTVNYYKLTFKIDGTLIEESEVAYGSEIIAPEAPEKEGYGFTGWIDLPATMPAEDLEITGTYTVNYYTLTVYVNDETYMTETLAYGAEIVIPDPEAPENMKFEGWTEEIPATMPAHDVVINGTMVPDESTSVIGIMFDKDEVVSIFNLNGVLLYKDVRAGEIKEALTPGLYIINGKKVMVK